MKHWRLVYLAIPLTIAVFLGILWHNEAKSPELCAGVGRTTEVYKASGCADEAETAEYRLVYHTEGESPVPVWWDPDEDMAVEWTDNTADNARLSHSVDYNARCDVGCPDYNIETTIYGWDGHRAEPWELQLMARIVYLEFLGCSQECCEAGVDSILNLWDSGYFSSTLGGTLSATAENGALVYTTYGYVWDWTYDPDDLAWCMSLCEERFYNGPRWNCCFFQLYGYPAWAEPLYCMDGVYFSTGKGW